MITKFYQVFYHYSVNDTTFNQIESIPWYTLKGGDHLKLRKWDNGDLVPIKYKSKNPSNSIIKLE